MSQESTLYSDWIGRSSTHDGFIDLEHARAIAATLNRDPESILARQPLPPLWHWCFLQDVVAQSQLAQDGHAQRGGFLPPIELPKRMWAGSRIRFHEPVLIANRASRQSTIKSIQQKQGQSGELVFVTVEHSISQEGRLCVVEEQDIVYRAAPAAGRQEQSKGPTRSPIDPPAIPQFSKQIKADPTLLFRYSAVTFNAHRIHYDRDYATRDENYPGLLVHGPLLATLLLELLGDTLSTPAPVNDFTFRALSPVYDLTPFMLCGKKSEAGYNLWVSDEQGKNCLRAEASLR